MIDTTNKGNNPQVVNESDSDEESDDYDPEAGHLGYDSCEEETEQKKGPVVINLSL